MAAPLSAFQTLRSLRDNPIQSSVPPPNADGLCENSLDIDADVANNVEAACLEYEGQQGVEEEGMLIIYSMIIDITEYRTAHFSF